MARLIITGCPRSGTHYLYNVFNQAGFFTTHETMLSPEGINRDLYKNPNAVDISWCAPRSFQNLEPSDVVMHVTRNPLLVARSLRNMEVMDARQGVHFKCIKYVLGTRFLDSSIPELDFWILWNKIVEQRAMYRFRIEDFNFPRLKAIVEYMGWQVEMTPQVLRAIEERDKHGCQFRDPVDFDLKSYESIGELAYMSCKYGYKLGGPDAYTQTQVQ